MLGVLITLLFSVGAACFGHLLIRKLTETLDPALRLGINGLVGLGAIGMLTLPIGLVPGGLSSVGMVIVILVALVSGAVCARGLKNRTPLDMPKGQELLFPAALALALLFALISVLAPADMVEWDSLAYHLAVPKMWLQAGQIQPVSFIHHSNFPFSVDNLYIWGVAWGGQAGAKAFTLAFHIYGIFAVFGFTRQVYGRLAGWWAALAWTTIPAVLWLSGTAYIDVQNGLYAGLGILFAAMYAKDNSSHKAWLAGIMLGLATGSKYTGLQTIFAIGVVLVASMILTRRTGTGAVRGVALICGLALLIASPWYVKNIAWTGNPVYPFFYSKLGGKHWSDWQAKIYQNEQQTFGAARPAATPEHTDYTAGPLQPQRIGHAVLGLAYQPGRYINPDQTHGRGFPIGAIGFVVVGSLLVWLISGRASRFESSVLAIVLVSLGMWFVLSEQSRYIIALGVPLSVLAGGAVSRLRTGPFLAGAIVLQALYSFYILKTNGGRFDAQLQVVTGRLPAADYMAATTPFYKPAEMLNQIARGGRVALFDEVFGYLLDVPYIWANPGHTDEFGYERMETADDFVAALKAKGITHVYLSIPGREERWIRTFGAFMPPEPYTAEERAPLMQDPNARAKVLLGEAIAAHKINLVQPFIDEGQPPRLVLAVQ